MGGGERQLSPMTKRVRGHRSSSFCWSLEGRAEYSTRPCYKMIFPIKGLKSNWEASVVLSCLGWGWGWGWWSRARLPQSHTAVAVSGPGALLGKVSGLGLVCQRVPSHPATPALLTGAQGRDQTALGKDVTATHLVPGHLRERKKVFEGLDQLCGHLWRESISSASFIGDRWHQ